MTAWAVWAVFAAAAALAAAALARPLLRRPSERAADAGRADFDMQVFRRQLADLEADVARGLVAPGEADAARLEIERRILAAAAEAERGGAAESGAGGRRAGALALAAAIGAGVPALSLALYTVVGAPGEPDRPLAERLQRPAPAIAAEGMPVDVEEAMARLAERLREAPDNLAGWLLLARSYAATGRFDEAAEAFANASALAPGDADIAASHGETLFHAAGGVMTPAAARRFEDALALDPAHPGARYYGGVAALQAGDGPAALAAWSALAADAAADAPWLPEIRRRAQALAAELGVDPPTDVNGGAD